MNGPARTTEIDAIRGFALLGICIVNVPFLAQPPATLLAPATGSDFVVRMFIQCLVEGKFFILFAFVFGWGFGVQLRSAERAGVPPAPRLLRRLLGLALIGAAHAVLVFFGDILLLYALLGLPLLLLRDASPRRLLAIAGAAQIFAAAGLIALALSLGEIAQAAGAGQIGAGYAGGFLDGLRQRIRDWPIGFGFILLFNGPMSFAAFCAGLAAAKVGFFDPGNAAYARLLRAAPVLLAAAIPLNGAYAMASSGLFGQTAPAAIAFAGLALGGPALSALYLLAIVGLARGGRLSAGMAAAGRMSLTAYVLEGALAGLVFNGYGLGLYGRVGAGGCLLIALAIYAGTHAFAVLWRRLAGDGPLERILRSITRGND